MFVDNIGTFWKRWWHKMVTQNSDNCWGEFLTLSSQNNISRQCQKHLALSQCLMAQRLRQLQTVCNGLWQPLTPVSNIYWFIADGMLLQQLWLYLWRLFLWWLLIKCQKMWVKYLNPHFQQNDYSLKQLIFVKPIRQYIGQKGIESCYVIRWQHTDLWCAFKNSKWPLPLLYSKVQVGPRPDEIVVECELYIYEEVYFSWRRNPRRKTGPW